MIRRALLPALTVVAALALAGCGSGHDTAADPAGPGTSSSQPPTSQPPTTPATTPATPTASPTVGTYPPYAPEDYAFDLVVSCFCAGANTPIEVTVMHAKVVGAVYLTDDTGRGGGKKGDPADKYFWVTINDVIAKANDVKADRVKVDWPAGQDYPNRVYVDPDLNAADEEVGYTISNVRVGS